MIEQKIIEILKKYDNPCSWWRGISPLKYQEVAEEIVELFAKEKTMKGWVTIPIKRYKEMQEHQPAGDGRKALANVDWAGLDPVKFKDVGKRKYVVFGDTEDTNITP